jgi:hypothetical protein
MAITTLDGIIAAPKQTVLMRKTTVRTSVAASWFSTIDVAGSPGAGVLAGTSTTAGVVPTDATAGCPPINAFSGVNKGYISAVEFSNYVACRIRVYDLLFKAGAYAFNANTALTGQPSYAGRVPGADYSGLEIWVEQVTASTLNQAVNVSYVNQNASGGTRTTGAVGIGSVPTVGRMWQLPLQSGDTGVQQITNVTGTVASAGTFNVLVLRPLWTGRVRSANDGDTHDFLKTGLPEVFADSALFVAISPESTTTGGHDLMIDVING